VTDQPTPRAPEPTYADVRDACVAYVDAGGWENGVNRLGVDGGAMEAALRAVWSRRPALEPTAPDDLQDDIAEAVDALVRAVHDTERESDVALATGPWLFDYEKVLRRNLTAAVVDVLRQRGHVTG